MSAYMCPSCGGGFPKLVDLGTTQVGHHYGCPWCGCEADHATKSVIDVEDNE